MPDDRLSSADAEKKLPQPEVYIMRDGEAVFKPGMKTWFVETKNEDSSRSSGVVHGQTGYVVGGTVCTCNTVCTCESVSSSECSCNSVCTCESVCSCVGECSCNSVCTCESVCSCVGDCSCNSVCTCQSTGGGYCSCNKVCSCVPVH